MLALLLSTLIPALVPAAVDGVRGVMQKISGGAGAQPANVDEVIKLMTARVDMIKAIAELDKGGTTYQWVEAIRQLQRPIIAGFVLLAWFITNGLGYGDDLARDQTAQLAGIVFGYLFGERTLFYAKKAAK